jgi:hypothetical protein
VLVTDEVVGKDGVGAAGQRRDNVASDDVEHAGSSSGTSVTAPVGATRAAAVSIGCPRDDGT